MTSSSADNDQRVNDLEAQIRALKGQVALLMKENKELKTVIQRSNRAGRG